MTTQLRGFFMGWNRSASEPLVTVGAAAGLLFAAMLYAVPASSAAGHQASPTLLQSTGNQTTIEITSPQEGDEFEPGDVVPIHGNATGDIESVNVTVGAEELDVEGEENWETNWTARKNVDSITIRATATNETGQTAQDSVTIQVAQTDPGPPVDPDPEPEENGDVQIPFLPAPLTVSVLLGATLLLSKRS